MRHSAPAGPAIGHYFVDLLQRRGAALDEETRALVEELCDAVSQQHSCLDLAGAPKEAVRRLQALPCVGTGGDGEAAAPLVLRDNLLYLQRYFAWEKQTAALLGARNRPLPCAAPERLREELDKFFPEADDTAPDRQRLAALQALTRQLLIITGGPGTGKTHTVARIVALLLELAEKQPVIRLAAPTGKAAMRLKESLGDDLSRAGLELADQVVTLHRLLGMRPDGGGWRHNADNPIDADVLIVDEASMIDLSMAHRLLSAVPPNARLILLGDADQLPSIDVGCVLADLCAGVNGYSQAFAAAAQEFVRGRLPAADSGHRLVDAVCRFERNYRFAADSGLGRLTQEIKTGTAAFGPDQDGVRFLELSELQKADLAAFFADYIALLKSGETDAAKLLRALESARVLCPRRQAVAAINQALETALEQQGLKRPGQDFYAGKPVMVTRNDYKLMLFNGDVGICLLDDDGECQAAFPDLADEHGEMRREPALRLRHWETCFAMTVHKSQGSEFDHVILLLDDAPGGAEQLQTRALLYTAATRARSRLSIHGNEALWRQALENTSRRTSGLGAFLNPPAAPGAAPPADAAPAAP